MIVRILATFNLSRALAAKFRQMKLPLLRTACRLV
jgi:hypothetical protein